MATWVTRTQWGARAAEGRRYLVPNNVDGIGIHWPGMASVIDVRGDIGFRRACSALRGWQRFHMDDRGWSDIAYQAAVDNAGRKYDLRGLAVQSGANGNQDVNERYGALLLILAPGERMSAEMILTSREVIGEFQRRFPQGDAIRPHSAIRPDGTTCPGPIARAAISGGVLIPRATTPPPTPTPPPADDWEAIMALFNNKDEYIEATAQGVELGVGRYVARFLKDEAGSGDTMLDDVKAHRQAELSRLDAIVANTKPVQ